MSKAPNKRSLILLFIIGIILGITAKLVDVPAILFYFPIFDDIMGRFGIWGGIAMVTPKERYDEKFCNTRRQAGLSASGV